LRLKEALESRKPMRDSFRVVEPIDANDERAAHQALEHMLDER
jgi:hypothetical protein